MSSWVSPKSSLSFDIAVSSFEAFISRFDWSLNSPERSFVDVAGYMSISAVLKDGCECATGILAETLRFFTHPLSAPG